VKVEMSQDGKDLEAAEAVNHECSTSIRDCKQEKRNAKMQMTRLLNKLASVLTEDDSSVDIKALLEKIQEQQENTLENSDILWKQNGFSALERGLYQLCGHDVIIAAIQDATFGSVSCW